MRRTLIVLTIILAMAMGFWLYSCSKKTANLNEATVEHIEHAGMQLYHCPMHPTYTSDKPGECPICGMTLVPVEEEKLMAKKKVMYRSTMNPNEVSDRPGKDSMGMEMEPFELEESPAVSTVEGRSIVKISPEKQQIIGVKTGIVEKRKLVKKINTVGRVDYVEPELKFVNTKFEGWVEKLYIDYTGQFVRKGTPLAEIYSPELVSTQQEYLLAYKTQKNKQKDNVTDIISSNFTIIDSARQRLKLWDITDDQIRKLEEKGEIKKTLTVHSPVNGFVIEKNVLQGQKIMPGENLYKIADISTVWIYGDVYEYEIPLIKHGQGVNITLSYFPGETFKGKVDYIYPYLNQETRTNRVRILAENPGFELKPGMYANLELMVDYGTKLVVPFSAVLDSGERKYVFVDIGDGYFEPREVKLGISTDDYYEVLEGLKEGERVVTSATFLIDSESSLKSAIEQMGKPGEGHASHGQ
jgi:Cu(I)/Ag(I) efflux system membrane fusion protein/cobalt-zinc-cadmium efflux system membrane fusion protein